MYIFVYTSVYILYTCVYIPLNLFTYVHSRYPHNDHSIVSLINKQSSLTKHKEVNQTPKAYG